MTDFYQLDEKDLELLNLLSKDSRTTFSYLAEHINTSIPTVKSRIDKLLGLGIIDRFTYILNYELLSQHPIYFANLKVIPNKLNDLLNFLLGSKLIIEVHELVASNQILFKTIPISMNELNDFQQILRRQDGILEVNVMPLVHTYRQETAIIPTNADLTVKLRCEYCGKSIEKNYQTRTIEGVTHYLCCSPCAILYEEEQSKQKK